MNRKVYPTRGHPNPGCDIPDHTGTQPHTTPARRPATAHPTKSTPNPDATTRQPEPDVHHCPKNLIHSRVSCFAEMCFGEVCWTVELGSAEVCGVIEVAVCDGGCAFDGEVGEFCWSVEGAVGDGEVALCGDIGEVAAESEAGVGEGGVGREDDAG